MSITGPVTPSSSTTRQQSHGRSAARDRFERQASQLGVDGKAKAVEPAVALTRDIDPSGWWLIPAGGADLGNNIFDYSVLKIFKSALGKEPDEEPLDGVTGMKARNACETDNTETMRAGYVITPGSTTCGVKIGVKPIGPTRVKCMGYEKDEDSGEWVLTFEMRNDPIYYGVPD